MIHLARCLGRLDVSSVVPLAADSTATAKGVELRYSCFFALSFGCAPAIQPNGLNSENPQDQHGSRRATRAIANHSGAGSPKHGQQQQREQ